jgi:ribosomal protein L17
VLQSKWQSEAKAVPIGRRDERALWEQFRAACDAVFEARQAKRQEEDLHKNESRRALEDLCAQLERLALETGQDDQAIRRLLRELQEQWNGRSGGFSPALRNVQSRFDQAKTAVEAMLSARVRSRKAAVWEILAKKERLCEELDSLVRSDADQGEAATRTAAAQEQWMALPVLSADWEQKMIARRDAALHALSDNAAAEDYRALIEAGAPSRRQSLVELELLLGLESPAEDQARRLALQVKKLKDRFQRAATTNGDGAMEHLLAWCTQPGVCSALERQRSELIFSKIGQARGGARSA